MTLCKSESTKNKKKRLNFGCVVFRVLFLVFLDKLQYKTFRKRCFIVNQGKQKCLVLTHKRQSCHYIETSHVTDFCMMATLAFNGLNIFLSGNLKTCTTTVC